MPPILAGNDPDYRTPMGDCDCCNQSNLAGYPAGTVNRHYYPGIRAKRRNRHCARAGDAWTATAATKRMAEASSYMNMAVEAELDIQTNEMTVHVEAYYTGSSPESTNKLNVALTAKQYT